VELVDEGVVDDVAALAIAPPPTAAAPIAAPVTSADLSLPNVPPLGWIQGTAPIVRRTDERFGRAVSEFRRSAWLTEQETHGSTVVDPDALAPPAAQHDAVQPPGCSPFSPT
jgi:hypothetical protein